MDKLRVIFGSFRVKVTIALILSLLFVVGLSDFLIYKFSLDSQLNQLRDGLKAVAQTSSLMVDSDALLHVPLNREGTDSLEYRLIAEKLRQIKKANPRILYIYTMTKTEAPGVWQFIVDPEPVSAEGGRKRPTSYPGDKYDASLFPEMLRAFDGPSADEELMVDDWGVTLSGYAPIRDNKGAAVAILGIDMSAEDVYATQKEIKRRAGLVLTLGIFISLALGVLISKGISDPVKRLSEGTRRIAAGDLQYKVEIKGNDEISRLGVSFNEMAASLYESRRQLQDYFYRVVQSLVRSIEAKDSYTRGHSDRVAEYAQKIALKMGFTPEKAQMIKKVAQLHDVGKLGIDESVLNKKEKLTEEEWRIIKEHPITGEEILRPVFLDEKMLALVRSHHERYDGKGYPDGLKGGEIDILAQIVSVTDSYDAMTSMRAYRKSMTREEAIDELKKNSGTQFNPEIVEAFLKVLRDERS